MGRVALPDALFSDLHSAHLKIVSLLARDGYLLIHKLIQPTRLVDELKLVIREHVQATLALVGKDCNENFTQLLDKDIVWDRSPDNWTGQPWGCVGLRGYIPKMGSGRMFDSPFSSARELRRVQECTRDITARFYNCSPWDLTLKADRVSVKPPFAPEWVAHIDDNRRDGLQICIALTSAKFIIYPRTHTCSFLRESIRTSEKTDRFYPLADADLDFLQKNEYSKAVVQAEAGDVLMFPGGLVHSSPGVSSGEPLRMVAYTKFQPAL